jgi:hypothetical protein
MRQSASELAPVIRDSAVRQRVLNDLHAAPEAERFDFIMELLRWDRIAALWLANACLRDQAHFARLLEVAVTRNVSELKHWFAAIVPRLGMRRVANFLGRRLDDHPEEVVKAAYVLPRFLGDDDMRGKAAYERLESQIRQRGLRYESTLIPDPDRPGTFLLGEAKVKKNAD